MTRGLADTTVFIARESFNDSWIAATAISLGVPVITQDDDYVEVDGLQVIKV